MTIAIDGNGFITPLTNIIPSIIPAGQFAHFMLPAAPVGWIVGDGSTIGSPASGATRANIDTQALFLAWWAYTDAQLPILTSTGSASTRGASALADWNANKRLTVFDVRDRVPRVAGTSFVNGTKYATTTQDHNHRTSMGSDSGAAYSWLNGSNNPVFGSDVISGAAAYVISTGGFSASTNVRIAWTEGIRSGSLAGESAPNTIAMLGCFKL